MSRSVVTRSMSRSVRPSTMTLVNVPNVGQLNSLNGKTLAILRATSRNLKNIINRRPNLLNKIAEAKRLADKKRRLENTVRQMATLHRPPTSDFKHRNIIRGKLVRRAGINYNTGMVSNVQATNYMRRMNSVARHLESIRIMPKPNLNRNENGNFTFSHEGKNYRLVRGGPGNTSYLQITRYGTSGPSTATERGVRLSDITTKGQRRAMAV